jgi:NAD(P)-dependent dehydrogenase (short-subunit alcohol dehydrogenase family)
VSDMRFDGRVAVITGAGGQVPSMGRSHAKFFASRGAKVVVNDLGCGPDGRGTLRANADEVVQEIRQAGGEAIVDTHDVGREDGCQAIIDAALSAWGQVDIVVNNAHTTHLAEFDVLSSDDVRQQVDVNLMGAVWLCRAAWPHMKAASYGRIVNISSMGVFGGHSVSIYSATKGGVFSLSNSLAVEGDPYDIKVNTLAVGALTSAMTLHLEDTEQVETLLQAMPVEAVSPAVAFLCHADCPVSGKFFMTAGGAMSEFVFGQTDGISSSLLTPEEIRDRFDVVRDRSTMHELPPPSLTQFIPAKPYVPSSRA